jgi:hypothetical protein
MTDGMSVINLGDLARPANTLIEKISDAIEGAFRPLQIKRVAKAEGEAAIILAKSNVEITDLNRRAAYRWLSEETQKQLNMENITKKALPLVQESSKPQEMDNDWIVNFFDKGRLISDEQIQLIWAKILAGEANSPTSFSKRTVNLLASFDKEDAEIFTHLCSFICIIGERSVPIIMYKSPMDQIYSNGGIEFDTINHLDDIGLIDFDSLGVFQRVSLKQDITVFYGEKQIKLHFKGQEKNSLSVGNVILTQVGRELSAVCPRKEISGFCEFVSDYWNKSGEVSII